jgi:hypothetical protein
MAPLQGSRRFPYSQPRLALRFSLGSKMPHLWCSCLSCGSTLYYDFAPAMTWAWFRAATRVTPPMMLPIRVGTK